MFMYGLVKQNYPSVMEEVHRSIECGKRRNDQNSLSYNGDWAHEGESSKLVSFNDSL